MKKIILALAISMCLLITLVAPTTPRTTKAYYTDESSGLEFQISNIMNKKNELSIDFKITTNDRYELLQPGKVYQDKDWVDELKAAEIVQTDSNSYKMMFTAVDVDKLYYKVPSVIVFEEIHQMSLPLDEEQLVQLNEQNWFAISSVKETITPKTVQIDVSVTVEDMHDLIPKDPTIIKDDWELPSMTIIKFNNDDTFVGAVYRFFIPSEKYDASKLSFAFNQVLKVVEGQVVEVHIK